MNPAFPEKLIANERKGWVKLILSKELGRLSKWLRILGFDAAYFRQDNASSLIISALRDDRVIVTRNHRLSRPAGIRVILIKSEHLKEQLAEILKALGIAPDESRMFTRCIICNEALVGIEKSAAKDKVPSFVFDTQENFLTCPNCKRVYWQGTHWGNVAEILKNIG